MRRDCYLGLRQDLPKRAFTQKSFGSRVIEYFQDREQKIFDNDPELVAIKRKLLKLNC